METPLIGSVSAAGTFPSAWPSGTTQGDLAVVALLGTKKQNDFIGFAPGWAWAGDLVDGLWSGLLPWFTTRVFWQVVSSSAPNFTRWQQRAALLAFGDTVASKARIAVIPDGRVQTVLKNRWRANAEPNGGIFTVTELATLTGLTQSTEHNLAWSGAGFIPGTYLRGKFAWADAPSGGLVGSSDTVPWGTECVSLLIRPPEGPRAAVQLAPVGDVGDAEPLVRFAFAHQPVWASGAQKAYILAIKPVSSGTWQYYNAATGALVASPIENESAVGEVLIARGLFTLDLPYQWQVWTQELADDQWSTATGTSTFTVVASPTVVITSTNPPLNDLTPTTTWTPTTPAGAQVAWQKRFVRPGGEIFGDTGWTPGADTSHTVQHPLAWVNGEDVVAQVRIRKTGGAESAWASAPSEVTWTEPAVPLIAVAATDTGVAVLMSTTDTGTTFELERRLLGGTEWLPVAMLPQPPAGPLTFSDVICPRTDLAVYRLRTHSLLEGVPLASTWSESGPVENTDSSAYLVDETDPRVWLQVSMVEEGDRVTVRDETVDYPLGATKPLVTYGEQQGEQGSVTLAVETWAEWQTLSDWLLAGRALRFCWPLEGGADIPSTRMAAMGVTVGRLAQSPMIGDRRITFDWVTQ